MPDAKIDIKFARLVWNMRKAQNDYFEHRTQMHLQAAKDLENQVDKWLVDILEDVLRVEAWLNGVGRKPYGKGGQG
ncbi:MAG: hypothetical protein ACOYYJ_17260 [Chloroflexota bacterium]